jgi:hypothetical protein
MYIPYVHAWFRYSFSFFLYKLLKHRRLTYFYYDAQRLTMTFHLKYEWH